QACIAFLCDCGVEVQSKAHSWCPISNFTLVRKEALTEHLKSRSTNVNPSQAMLKCPLCPNYYNSASSVYHHLWSGHNKSPKEAGIAFRCECGKESYSHSSHQANGKKVRYSPST
ncbi:hypothetical protein PFISCL1PPCAC_26000, partial [Pristionchus fissidentatus]